MIEFTSPYNRKDKIDEREYFHAIDGDGEVYDVYEHYVVDNRRKSGFRLTRIDVSTGECLLNRPLYVLPRDFVESEHWLMVQMVEVLDRLAELESDLRCANENIENLEQRHDNP